MRPQKPKVRANGRSRLKRTGPANRWDRACGIGACSSSRTSAISPAEALAKAELARKIGMLIANRGLTQAAAAELLKIDQPKVSAPARSRLAGFSLDRLVRFLVLLGNDVEIVTDEPIGGRQEALSCVSGEFSVAARAFNLSEICLQISDKRLGG